jgi:hypothetical protein
LDISLLEALLWITILGKNKRFPVKSIVCCLRLETKFYFTAVGMSKKPSMAFETPH